MKLKRYLFLSLILSVSLFNCNLQSAQSQENLYWGMFSEEEMQRAWTSWIQRNGCPYDCKDGSSTIGKEVSARTLLVEKTRRYKDILKRNKGNTSNLTHAMNVTLIDGMRRVLSPRESTLYDGDTLLHQAVLTGKTGEVFKLLSCDDFYTMIFSRNREGDTPLKIGEHLNRLEAQMNHLSPGRIKGEDQWGRGKVEPVQREPDYSCGDFLKKYVVARRWARETGLLFPVVLFSIFSRY